METLELYRDYFTISTRYDTYKSNLFLVIFIFTLFFAEKYVQFL